MPIRSYVLSRRTVLGATGAMAAATVLPRVTIAKTNQVTLLHGGGAALLGWAPSFIAESVGYYKDEGLTVERLYNGSGPAGLTALVSGSGTALLSAPGELLVAVARGQKLRAIFGQSAYQAGHLVLSKQFSQQHGVTADMPAEQKYAKFKGFKGIRIGISTPGSLTDLEARSALTRAGMDPVSDAQIVPLGSVPNGLAALGSGRIDAFTGASPAPEQAVAQFGAQIFLSVGKDEFPGLKAMAGMMTEARASDLEADPSLYEAIVRADTRGLKRIIDDPAECGEIMRTTRFPNMPPEAWDLAWRGNISQFYTPYVKQEALAAWLLAGAVPGFTDPSAISLRDVADMRFVDQAVAKIRWARPL